MKTPFYVITSAAIGRRHVSGPISDCRRRANLLVVAALFAAETVRPAFRDMIDTLRWSEIR